MVGDFNIHVVNDSIGCEVEQLWKSTKFHVHRFYY